MLRKRSASARAARSYTRRYVPKQLTRRDVRRQVCELERSRRAYKKGKYYTRKRMASFRSVRSPHLRKAMRMYKVAVIGATPQLARATQCSRATLRAILRKGKGAYFSSGSRPNQTAQSWAIARLASAVSGGKASAVDFTELQEGCRATSKALRLAKTARRRYKNGTRRVAKRTVRTLR